MYKRLTSLLLALIMCFALSVTAFAEEIQMPEERVLQSEDASDENDCESTAELEENLIDIAPDGTFQILIPSERINADGTFRAEFKRGLNSDHFNATNTYLSISLTSMLVNDDNSPDPSDPAESEYADGTFDVTLYGDGVNYESTQTIPIYGNTSVAFYGLRTGKEYYLNFSSNESLYNSNFSILVTGTIRNISVLSN